MAQSLAQYLPPFWCLLSLQSAPDAGSGTKHKGMRDLARSTWMKLNSDPTVIIKFVVGNSHEPAANAEVHAEALQHNDILHLDVVVRQRHASRQEAARHSSEG